MQKVINFILVLLGGLSIFCAFSYGKLLIQNSQELEKFEATVLSVEDISIIPNSKSPDSIKVEMTIEYEKDGQIKTSSFIGISSDTSTKEMLISLKEEDSIIVYNNVFGLSLDNGEDKLKTGLFISITFFIIIFILFIVEITPDKISDGEYESYDSDEEWDEDDEFEEVDEE